MPTDLIHPDAIPPANRERVRSELGILSGDTVVTMVSRVIRSKGVLEFAKAAEIVRQRDPSVKFVLVGPADRDSLDRLNDEEAAQLRRTVAWLGSRDDVKTLLSASHIFVLPSFYREGIPRALIEAAAMGLPLVTTNVPGCREVVEHGTNGFIVSPRDSNSLAEAVLRLTQDVNTRQRFGAESRRRAVAIFDLSRVAERLTQVYWELLASKKMLTVT